MLLIADAWTAVGGIAAIVAAGGALVTILYARSTVREARQAREQSAFAHREEMAERARALAEERRLRQVEQVQRVTDLVLEVADTARRESFESGRLMDGPVRLPSVRRQLGAALSALRAFGGPELGPSSRQLVERAYVFRNEIVSDSVSSLDEIKAVLDSLPEGEG